MEKLALVAGIIYLIIFIVGLMFSNFVYDWLSWYFGLAFGLAIHQVYDFLKYKYVGGKEND